MAGITSPLLFLFAIAPSLIWLAFFLGKDAHPEPNRMILKVFLLGALVAIPAIYLETSLEELLSSFALPRILFLLVYFLLGIAFVEELLKYVVVRIGALSNPALDEPVDVMIYMVVAALGFAALENILLLFGLIKIYPASDVFLVNGIRFVQAVFLHALASGLFGYFLALAIFRKKHAHLLTLTGLALAALLHGFFNFYIFTIGGKNFFFLLFPVLPLLLIGVIVSLEFRRLKLLCNKKLP